MATASLLVGLAGFVVGSISLVFAWLQVRRVGGKAEAAEQAARRALWQANRTESAAAAARCASLARETVLLIRAEDLSMAAVRTLDLRDAIADLRSRDAGTNLLTATGWDDLASRASRLYMTLEAASEAPPEIARAAVKLRTDAAEISDRIAALQSRARLAQQQDAS